MKMSLMMIMTLRLPDEEAAVEKMKATTTIIIISTARKTNNLNLPDLPPLQQQPKTRLVAFLSFIAAVLKLVRIIQMQKRKTAIEMMIFLSQAVMKVAVIQILVLHLRPRMITLLDFVLFVKQIGNFLDRTL